MRHARCWIGMLFALFLLNACSDSPTAPEAKRRVGSGVQKDGSCTSAICLEPIGVVVTPGCDPWLDPNWCEGPADGECMESVGSSDPTEITTLSCAVPGSKGGETTLPGSGGSPSPSGTAPDSCRTGDPLMDSPAVFLKFDALWRKSLMMGGEFGGWIVDTGTSYEFVPFQNAVSLPCGINSNDPPPPGTIAVLHTHPWRIGEWHTCGDGGTVLYTGTPSGEDTSLLQTFGVAQGYFIDDTGIGKHTPTGGEQAQRYPRCAY